MGHLYPLARSAAEALNAAEKAARTRHDAEQAAGGVEVLALETEWLTPSPEEAEALVDAAARGLGEGFVQRYEDTNGAPVLAVTYWKLASPPAAPAKRKTAAGKGPVQAKPKASKPPEPDHTDDLYFRGGRAKKRKPRKRPHDPRQLDLFSGPDPMGYEHRDPDNPDIILTGEEGDGTTFGS